MINIPPFEKFRKNPFGGELLTFDPGQTTGWTQWYDGVLYDSGQLPTFPVKDSVQLLDIWLDEKTMNPAGRYDPIMVVIEEYRVYSHKTDSHAQNDMHTSRLIGCLETLLTQKGIPYSMCGAGLAKTFATDEKLEAWGFWIRGQKHARDAIRHGCYWYCTPPKEKS